MSLTYNEEPCELIILKFLLFLRIILERKIEFQRNIWCVSAVLEFTLVCQLKYF